MYGKHLKAVHEAEEKAELAAGGEKKKHDDEDEEKEGEEEGEDHDEEHGEHEEHGEEEGGHGFPLPNVLFFTGFMSMLLIDRVVFKGKMEKVEVLNDHEQKKDTSRENQVVQKPDATTDKPNDQVNGETATVKNNYDGVFEEMETDASEEQARVSVSTLIAFGLAIIIHSLLDGLAIGVFDELSEITVLAVSVLIHRIPVACTVGTTFLSNGQPWNAMSSLILFVMFIISSPIGIVIGTVVGSSGNALTLSILQALSGGTFIYLACCDLLVHEFWGDKKHQQEDTKTGACMKYLSILMGSAVVIIILALSPKHEH